MNLKSALACLVLLPSTAHARDVEISATLYGWIPGLDASIGTAFGDLEFSPSGSDILSSLDMVFMGTFEGRKGRWSFIKDIIYVDLSDNRPTPFGALFSSADIDLKLTAASGYVGYRVYETGSASYDIVGGFRFFDVSTTTTLNAGINPTQTTRLSDSWWDPVIGVRGQWQLSDTWSATGFVDYGSWDNASESWQVVATLNYAISEKWAFRVGYRHMDINRTIDGEDVDLGLSGPIFGLAVKF